MSWQLLQPKKLPLQLGNTAEKAAMVELPWQLWLQQKEAATAAGVMAGRTTVAAVAAVIEAAIAAGFTAGRTPMAAGVTAGKAATVELLWQLEIQQAKLPW